MEVVMVSKDLKELRSQKGWSQEQMGQALGIHRGTLSHYERGTRHPSLEEQQRAALLLLRGTAHLEPRLEFLGSVEELG